MYIKNRQFSTFAKLKLKPAIGHTHLHYFDDEPFRALTELSCTSAVGPAESGPGF